MMNMQPLLPKPKQKEKLVLRLVQQSMLQPLQNKVIAVVPVVTVVPHYLLLVHHHLRHHLQQLTELNLQTKQHLLIIKKCSMKMLR